MLYDDCTEYDRVASRPQTADDYEPETANAHRGYGFVEPRAGAGPTLGQTPRPARPLTAERRAQLALAEFVVATFADPYAGTR